MRSFELVLFVFSKKEIIEPMYLIMYAGISEFASTHKHVQYVMDIGIGIVENTN